MSEKPLFTALRQQVSPRRVPKALATIVGESFGVRALALASPTM